jgi:tRNA (guanine-N7-)-methyltransferase
LATFSNVLEFPKDIKGKWNQFFKNENPIILELACGKGEYAIGLGILHPNKNYVGVDIKGNRIWVGAKKALENKLHNVAFLRTQIELVYDYFAEHEVSEIWITFPDPQLRKSKAKKRLTHPNFLRHYQQFLKPGGYIHLKSDSPDMYNFTQDVIRMYGGSILENYSDLYGQSEIADELKIKTHYESLDIAQSNRIHYLRFSLPAKLPGKDMDEKLKELIKDEH